jgi:hypothetical protein
MLALGLLQKYSYFILFMVRFPTPGVTAFFIDILKYKAMYTNFRI